MTNTMSRSPDERNPADPSSDHLRRVYLEGGPDGVLVLAAVRELANRSNETSARRMLAEAVIATVCLIETIGARGRATLYAHAGIAVELLVHLEARTPLDVCLLQTTRELLAYLDPDPKEGDAAEAAWIGWTLAGLDGMTLERDAQEVVAWLASKDDRGRHVTLTSQLRNRLDEAIEELDRP